MPYQHLALEERHYIETQRKLGVSQNRSTQALGRCQSSVSQELSHIRGFRGYLLAATRAPETGVLEAGCDPRGTKGEVSRRLCCVGKLQCPPPKTQGGGIANGGPVDVAGFIKGIDGGEGADTVGVE